EESEKQNLAEIIVSKHRHGETGTIEMVWLGQYQKFADSSRYSS
ncbi:MAG: DnaB-like helicase C-terminal domain-containing protein, partial [Bacillota bacterium]|nr:DnaB-like helicase C-terminal domain-containing protein [Bacillota bacterium]